VLQDWLNTNKRVQDNLLSAESKPTSPGQSGPRVSIHYFRP